jgi:hypothetical protein
VRIALLAGVRDPAPRRSALFGMDQSAPPGQDGVDTSGFPSKAIRAVLPDQLPLGLVVEDLVAVVVEEAHVFSVGLRRRRAIEQVPHLGDPEVARMPEVPQN